MSGKAPPESMAELSQTFNSYLDVMELDPATGKTIYYTGKQFLALSSSQLNYLSNIYIFRGKKADRYVYTFEVSGPGFWDKVSAYLTLAAGFQTIVGISFYDHKETPGLGQRIEEGWFQAQFSYWHKCVFQKGQALPAFHVTKRRGRYDGECTPQYGKKRNEVDAITGASETSRALDRFITSNLRNLFKNLARVTDQETVKKFFDLKTLALLKKMKTAH